jgi:ATP-dependent protease ClpP protease subunit
MTSTLYLAGDIDSAMVGAVLGQLEDGLSRIWLNSIGGETNDAFAIYDALIGRDVEIIATGSCMSAAIVVLLAGARRYATANCRFLTHPVQVSGDASQADRDEMSFLTHMVADLIHQRGTISSLKAEDLLRTETYFGAVYAQRIGLIHSIWHAEIQTAPGFTSGGTN